MDERGTTIGLTLLRSRAPKGERAFGKAPRNRAKNTTLLASMGAEGMGPCVAVEGATTAAVFEAYVEHFLGPVLKEEQVVVLDNLNAHKGERVRRLVEARGARLPFLPPCSPDFSPIEEAFSKLKAPLRRAGARTKKTLVEAIGRALDTITSEDARGWFDHCGYAVNDQSVMRTAVVASRDTPLRHVRHAPLPEASEVRVLGVDDWARRKGVACATILVDLEHRKPVDLLTDREASSLTDWLRVHPGVEFIGRDRAGHTRMELARERRTPSSSTAFAFYTLTRTLPHLPLLACRAGEAEGDS